MSERDGGGTGRDPKPGAYHEANGMTMRIRPETEADFPASAAVVRAAFGRDAEARLVTALRQGGWVTTSLVAESECIVGQVVFSRVAILGEGEPVAVLALAPVAVAPEFQRRGVGSRLIHEGLRVSAADGARIVFVLGHPEYYPRFGFSAALAEPFSPFGPTPAFMALELEAGALRGVRGRLVYPPPFGDVSRRDPPCSS